MSNACWVALLYNIWHLLSIIFYFTDKISIAFSAIKQCTSICYFIYIFYICLCFKAFAVTGNPPFYLKVLQYHFQSKEYSEITRFSWLLGNVFGVKQVYVSSCEKKVNYIYKVTKEGDNKIGIYKGYGTPCRLKTCQISVHNIYNISHT